MNQDRAMLVQVVSTYADALEMLSAIRRGESYNAVDYHVNLIGFYAVLKAARQHLESTTVKG